jgi:large subunit ribosomal protein L21
MGRGRFSFGPRPNPPMGGGRRDVQYRFVPKPDGSLSAIVVSGGKQYRVAPGDQILVDRMAAEPGSSVKLGRVLLLNDGGEISVGTPVIDGIEVEARVLAHRRGPRIENLRYKSKKRVRVHRGGRADLTALEILAVGGLSVATGTKTEAAPAVQPDATPKAKKPSDKKPSTRQPKAKPVAIAVEPEVVAEAEAEAPAEAPAKRAPRKPRTPKEPE